MTFDLEMTFDPEMICDLEMTFDCPVHCADLDDPGLIEWERKVSVMGFGLCFPHSDDFQRLHKKKSFKIN